MLKNKTYRCKKCGGHFTRSGFPSHSRWCGYKKKNKKWSADRNDRTADLIGVPHVCDAVEEGNGTSKKHEILFCPCCGVKLPKL